MELDVLHIDDARPRPMGHGIARADGLAGVRGVEVDGAAASGREDGVRSEKDVDRAGGVVQDIGPDALRFAVVGHQVLGMVGDGQ